jgi:hypothetical protein
MATDLKIWIETRKRYRLSHAQIQMARELGMNPKKFGSLATHRQERWKAPLPEFIQNLYFKRFGKEQPENVISIEALMIEIGPEKRERKRIKDIR